MKKIDEAKKLMAELKEALTESKELNVKLKEQINEYEQLTKSFHKTIPRGMFT